VILCEGIKAQVKPSESNGNVRLAVTAGTAEKAGRKAKAVYDLRIYRIVWGLIYNTIKTMRKMLSDLLLLH
jgi:hypothetical protein